MSDTRMVKVKKLWGPICAVTMVAACNTTDPRQGGFVGGVGGLVSGSYDQRIEDRESRLDQLSNLNTQLAEDTQNIERQRADIAEQEKALNISLDRLGTKLSKTRAALEQARAENRITKVVYDANIKKLTLLSAEQNTLTREAKQRRSQVVSGQQISARVQNIQDDAAKVNEIKEGQEEIEDLLGIPIQ
ncbi:MAG: hypothetical protein ACPGOY_13440 [Rhodospirillaceae bacterium]